MAQHILKNKNCLITGATGGLGSELAMEFFKNGTNLFLIGRDIKKLESLKTQLEKSTKNHGKIVFDAVDLTNITDIQRLVKKIRSTLQKIDILINCAGVFPVKQLSDYTLIDFENCFNINVRAPFILCKEFSQDMVNKKWGRIINIASSSAYKGFKNTSIYCASKHALLGFSRSIHSELKEHNVRTFCVSPGSMKTSMSKEVLEKPDYETFLNPKEVAEFVVFLVSFDKEMSCEEIQLNRIEYD
jgi:short-subunit dehydrogenase